MTFILIYSQMQKLMKIFSIFVTDVQWHQLYVHFCSGVVTTLHSSGLVHF